MRIDDRTEKLFKWATSNSVTKPYSLLAKEASTRSFYRGQQRGKTVILVDAPPDTKQNNEQFLYLSPYFRSLGLYTPEFFAFDLAQGFFLVEDLGKQDYFTAINSNSKDQNRLYNDAIEALLKLYLGSHQSKISCPVPIYTQKRFSDESDLFNEWFVKGLLGKNTEPLWTETKSCLLSVIEEQPCCCVHRDFHSRNLISIGINNPGIVDYQDALWGPLTYDLVSLLKDCYITLPESFVNYWQEQFRYELSVFGNNYSVEQFNRWCDFTASQRHLKAIGIFARLKLSAGNYGWLKHISPTLEYLISAGQKWSELKSLGYWIKNDLQPSFINWMKEYNNEK